MKKRIAVILILIPLLLCSCTSVNRLFELLDMKNDIDEGAKKNQALQIELPDDAVDALLQDGFEAAETSSASDWGFTEYSLEELIEGLTNRAPMTDASGAPLATMPNPDPDASTADTSSVTVAFSDAAWEDKTVEEVDITQYMTPEEKAQWEADMASMNEAELEAEMAEMTLAMEEMINSLGGDAVPTPEGATMSETTDAAANTEVKVDDYYKQLEDALKEAQGALDDAGLGGMFGNLGDLIGGLMP